MTNPTDILYSAIGLCLAGLFFVELVWIWALLQS